MNNSLTCAEGTLDFEEDVKIQTINILAFRTGQHITINRDRLPTGQTLTNYTHLQINNAEKSFNQFNLVKVESVNHYSAFIDTVKVVYNFIPQQGFDRRVWQVSYACLVSGSETLNFTSIYPDESSMNAEVHRLEHCVKAFIPHEN